MLQPARERENIGVLGGADDKPDSLLIRLMGNLVKASRGARPCPSPVSGRESDMSRDATTVGEARQNLDEAFETKWTKSEWSPTDPCHY